MPLKIAVLSGAGISAASGLKTFRDAGGLWENYDIMEVASIEGWRRNPSLVLDFYNQRRKQAFSAIPNAAHYALVELESVAEVEIITQNVDRLHEKAGSRNVLHLHGDLHQARCSVNSTEIIELEGKPIAFGDVSSSGNQLRPNIVWFGEMVPMLSVAAQKIRLADILLVIGTSLAVYPAAGLVNDVRLGVKIVVIDPNADEMMLSNPNVSYIASPAEIALPTWVETFKNALKKA
jgi:NAD-dependent deacetylase